MATTAPFPEERLGAPVRAVVTGCDPDIGDESRRYAGTTEEVADA